MRNALFILALAATAMGTWPARAQSTRAHFQLTISGAAADHPPAPTTPAIARGGAPYNDECANALVQVLPYGGAVLMSGDNTGATDTENFGNPNVWEAFTIDTCSSVTVSYCGTAPVFGLVYSILLDGCPGQVSVQNSGTSTCTDGNTVVSFADLAAGTYYIPVLLWPGLAEGPYAITVSSTPCSLPPVNDACGAALPIAVVPDCALGTTIGNNSTATQSGNGPSCGTTTSQFQDVFYTFQSGASQQVILYLQALTAGDLGVEVRDACGGAVLLCATGDTAYTLPVDTGASYIVRISSNNDLGFGGAFSLCIVDDPLPPPCDGGQVTTSGGQTEYLQCGTDLSLLALQHQSLAAAPLALVLTDTAGTIISVVPGPTLDPAGLPLGTYLVHGISFLGDLLNDQPGSAITDLTSDGACFDRSDSAFTWTIDICQGGPGRPGDHAPPGITWVGGQLLVQGLLERSTARIRVYTAGGHLVDATSIPTTGGVAVLPRDMLPSAGLLVLVVEQEGAHFALRTVRP